MKKTSKLILIPITMFAMLFSFSFNVKKVDALYYPTSYYDAISWIYTYDATYTTSYNCLGWATGSMVWEWPSLWGSGAPKYMVDTYLATKGYSSTLSTNLSKRIIAYGPSSNSITHFSKVSSGQVSAKWGSLERFKHGISMDPYYASSDYGLARGYYV